MTDESEGYVDRLVDEKSLEAYLEAELGPAERFEVERHEEGHSNETLFLEWDDTELVLRRPPPGETADTAHDVLREYRVIDALQDTDVPVPTTVLPCEDHDVIGSDFYLMEREEGVVIRDQEPERFATPEHRERIGEGMIDTLAAIHTVDYEAVGLGELGYPEGFTQRQVDRWADQFAWAFEVTTDEREVPAIHEVTEWLRANVPEEHPHTLVHGDFTLDNVMFGPDPPPRVAAVLDWEMSTLGDPLADLGWMLSFWVDEGDESTRVGTSTDVGFLQREGYHTRDELVDRYEAATGMEFRNDRFYRVLAVYKMAALGEMFYRRHLEGNADNPVYPKMDWRVPDMADRALRIVEGEE